MPPSALLVSTRLSGSSPLFTVKPESSSAAVQWEAEAPSSKDDFYSARMYLYCCSGKTGRLTDPWTSSISIRHRHLLSPAIHNSSVSVDACVCMYVFFHWYYCTLPLNIKTWGWECTGVDLLFPSLIKNKRTATVKYLEDGKMRGKLRERVFTIAWGKQQWEYEQNSSGTIKIKV